VFDHGLILTLYAMRRQLSGMPHELYLIRLIHQPTRRPFPGERLWTAGQLLHPATVRFLRIRNREGCDVYIQPWAAGQNAGYILVDLDHTQLAVVQTMRSRGHEPCVVLQTSPGHLQAWVRVSAMPIEPAVATAIGKQLACAYGGDLASSDWRHLGRLAGFTNQKPQRRQRDGYAPFVKVLHAQADVATAGAALLEAAQRCLCKPPILAMNAPRTVVTAAHSSAAPAAQPLPPSSAARIYRGCLARLRIVERFPQPDWSIADKWVARDLLQRQVAPPQVAAIIEAGSPGFPRRHSDPRDYLRRTVARALLELHTAPFPDRAPQARDS
jgi:RepB DNA-primase from phage plasmid